MGLQRLRHDWATELNWTDWRCCDQKDKTVAHVSEYMRNKNSHTLLVGIYYYSANVENSLAVPQIMKYGVILTIQHLVIYPRKMKTYVHAKSYVWIFIAILYLIAKKQK